MRLVAAVLCTLSVGAIALADGNQADREKFVPLFDGRSFQGWEGDLNVFRIVDGAIVGGSLKKPLSHNEFLCTTKQYGDFELRVKFKVLGQGVNAGVQVRTRRIPNNPEVIGYQADIAEGHYGAVWDEGRRGLLASPLSPDDEAKIIRRDQWNDYVIRCEGDRVQLWINGHKTADYTEKDPAIPRRGVIGLQIHGGPPSEAWYKDIAIKSL